MLIFGAKIQMYLFRSCKMRLFKSDFQTLWNGLNFIPETFLDFYREIAKRAFAWRGNLCGKFWSSARISPKRCQSSLNLMQTQDSCPSCRENFFSNLRFHPLIVFLFFAVALLMPHFLPETKSTSDEICTRLKNPNDQNHTIEKEIEVSINDESVLVIPCLIFGIWLLLVGFGFVWHAFKGLNLPKHHAAQLVKSSEVVSGSPLPQESPFKHKIGLISLGVIFYFLTCGVDSYFQSQTYTVGLCGLSLSAQMAGWLNRYTYQFSF